MAKGTNSTLPNRLIASIAPPVKAPTPVRSLRSGVASMATRITASGA
jgi:hypothetical protein